MAVTNELIDAIELMKQGNEEGFAKVYAETYSYVYGRARYIMKEEQDALDLTQETFIQAYRSISSLQDSKNVYSWLGAIVYNHGMKIFNKKKELLVNEDQEGIFDDVVSQDQDTSPEQTAESKATSDIVMGMIEELPELQRAAIMAFYYDNMKIDEIAEMFECTASTVKSRLKYAKEFLKNKVEIHEKQNNYKLCSVTPLVMIMAFRSLMGTPKYAVSSQAAQAVYAGTCSALGIQAASMVGSGIAGSSVAGTGAVQGAGAGMFGTAGVAGTTGAGSSAVFGTVATVATKAGLGIAAKIGITIAALAVAGGIGTAVVMNLPDKTEEATPYEVVEMTGDNAQENQGAENVTKETETVTTTTDVQSKEANGDYIYRAGNDYEVSGGMKLNVNNSTETNLENGTCDISLEYRKKIGQGMENETITFANVTFSLGMAANVKATSSLGREWVVSYTVWDDGSIGVSYSVDNRVETGSIHVTKLAVQTGFNSKSIPVVGTYEYIPGTVVNDGKGNYTLEITSVGATDSAGKTPVIMKLTFLSKDGKTSTIENISIDYQGNVGFFSGNFNYDCGLSGYISISNSGELLFSYQEYAGATMIPYHVGELIFPSATSEPITLIKTH